MVLVWRFENCNIVSKKLTRFVHCDHATLLKRCAFLKGTSAKRNPLSPVQLLHVLETSHVPIFLQKEWCGCWNSECFLHAAGLAKLLHCVLRYALLGIVKASRTGVFLLGIVQCPPEKLIDALSSEIIKRTPATATRFTKHNRWLWNQKSSGAMEGSLLVVYLYLLCLLSPAHFENRYRKCQIQSRQGNAWPIPPTAEESSATAELGVDE